MKSLILAWLALTSLNAFADFGLPCGSDAEKAVAAELEKAGIQASDYYIAKAELVESNEEKYSLRVRATKKRDGAMMGFTEIKQYIVTFGDFRCEGTQVKLEQDIQ